jgi:V/A-type H+-transporting ATPase subunit I
MAILYSEPMKKMRIIALSRYRYELVKRLQELAIIDIKKSDLKLQDDKEMEGFPAISERLVRMEGALELLPKPPKGSRTGQTHRKARAKGIEELLKHCDSLGYVDEIFALAKEKEKLKGQAAELDAALANARSLLGIEADFSALSASGVLAYKVCSIANDDLAELARHLAHNRVGHEMISKPDGKKRSTALIVYAREEEQIFNKQMARCDYSSIEPSRYITTTPSRAVGELERSRKSATARMDEITERISEISNDKYYETAATKELLEIEYDRADISANFKKTDRTFVIEGWVAADRAKELEEEVAKMTAGAYAIERAHSSEIAPTYTKRNRFFKPFDYLVEFYSLPRSDEIDPTYIFFISLAIFYGLTVSDVGYGIFSFIIASLIIRKVNPEGLMGSVARIWRLFSVSIIFFGLLSNQFFGISLLGFRVIQKINWTGNITELIMLTIAMGIVQVALGLVLAFVNSYRHHETKHAIAKVGAILLLAFGTLAVAGALFHAFGLALTEVSAALAIAGLVVFAALSGIEAMEVTNIIAHPISYLRMLGFGLASVVLASLIDKAVTPTLSSGALVFILYLIMFIVLHVLNSIVSIFEGIVQGTRLNLIEFFSKFYKGGGTKFKPYYFKKEYTG